MSQEPTVPGDVDVTNPDLLGLTTVLSDRLLNMHREGRARCNPDLIATTSVALALAVLENFTLTPRGADLDVAEDVLGSPNLSLLDLRLRQQLTVANPDLCATEDVDFIAWMLAEAVLEKFLVEESGWVR